MQKTKTPFGYILNDSTIPIWVTFTYDLTRKCKLLYQLVEFN